MSEEIQKLIKFVQDNPDVCWVELRMQLAYLLRKCRSDLNLSFFEVMEKAEMEFEELQLAENGSEETGMMSYFKLYLFYRSYVK